MTEREVRQTVIGDRNIVTGTGDVNIVYTLPPTEAEERRSLLVLLERVRQCWIAGVLDGSVHGAALLELGTARMSDAVEHPWERILRRGIDFTGAPRLRFRLAQILASSGELDEASAILDAFTGKQGAAVSARGALLSVVPVEG